MIPDLASEGWGALGRPACFCVLVPCFFALLVLSVGLFASLERFTLEFGPSDSPRDALDVVFGGRNGVIWKISGECTSFVASIAFTYDFRVFSQRFSDRLSALFLRTLRSIWRLIAAARVG